MSRVYGERQTCTRCGMDVEYVGSRTWMGRGGDYHCDNSGAAGIYPHKRHTMYPVTRSAVSQPHASA